MNLLNFYEENNQLSLGIETEKGIFDINAYEENKKGKEQFDKIKIFDSINFITDKLLSKLIITSPKQQVTFHPVCSIFLK